MGRRYVVFAALAAALAIVNAVPAAASVPSWPNYHGTPDHQGDPGPVPGLTGAAPSWTSPALDGMVYAEPIVSGARAYVVTENDTFYSLDVTTGQIVWQRHVGTPVPLSSLPCGNIDPLGITGTPVLDQSTGLLYAIAEDQTGGIHHELYAVDTATDNVVFHRNADPPIESPSVVQQRAALALANGRVYWAFGGLAGDCGQYHGWVQGVAKDGSGPLLSYMVPSVREGAVWASAGIATDPSGNLFVATGNGANSAAQGFDHGNSIVKLDAGLHEVGAWASTSWGAWNDADADLGSTGALLLPNGDVFAVGKQQVAFLVDGTHLSGTKVGDGFAVAHLDMPGCSAFGGDAYDASNATVYVPCDGGTRAVKIDWSVTPPTMAPVAGWNAPGAAGSPIVAGGAVWVVAPDAGTLYALDPTSGSTITSFNIGHARHFASVAAAGGRVFVAADLHLHAFAPPGSPPPAPTGYTVDGWGGVHAYGGAPAVSVSAYWPGWDIARGVVVRRDGTGHVNGGYVADAWGGVHPFGGAPAVDASSYWPGWNIARSLALDPCIGGVVAGDVVDGWGGLHPFAQVGSPRPATPQPTATWIGADMVRGVAVTGLGQGLVLDAFGGIHPYGGAPNVFSTGYWFGWNVARGISLIPGTAQGFVVDAFGGLHGFGGAPASIAGTAYWPGWDIARGTG
jgi:outer membrane protein assembly factor BamB